MFFFSFFSLSSHSLYFTLLLFFEPGLLPIHFERSLLRLAGVFDHIDICWSRGGSPRDFTAAPVRVQNRLFLSVREWSNGIMIPYCNFT